jgi:peptidoglycan-associated lipoprotein
MKIVNKISLAVLPAMFLLVLLLGGCGTTGEVEEGTEAAPAAGAGAADSATTTPGAADGAGDAMPMDSAKTAAKADPFSDPNNLLSQRTVYFAFDSSSIPDDALPLIKAHAGYLAGNPSVAFTLEGHADERGTREYNIALGERRADAVRRMLMANGVSASQVNVISYGEERPAKPGHSEEAWQYNRRAVFVYSGK